jgi:RNA polymerase sigma factor (sigma-70 family)
LESELLEAFVVHRNEAAFEALVRRHGPMVLSVCRRVLQNHHDAEDAFQATFLVLARKAASIKPRHMVGNWLYGVAYRTALEARTVRHKRLTRQKPLSEIPEPAAPQPAEDKDLQVALDEELHRLPDHYRAVIVLCDLEGKTQKEAARQLACPPGTVACRLARGRSLLAKRLARHGLKLGGGALALALSSNAVVAGVPTPLVASTVKAATTVAAGGAAASVVSAKVAGLTKGVLTRMFLTKLKTALGMIVAVSFVGIGVGLLTFPALLPGQPTKATQVKQQVLSQETAAGGKSGVTKGLKLTLSADKTETSMKPDGSNAVPVKLKLTFTNVSKKPIKLNAYDLRLRLGFRCTGPSPDSVKTIIEEVKRPALPPPSPKDFPSLQPGKSWSPTWTHSFPGDIPQQIAKVVGYKLRKPGTYKLRFTYANLKQGDDTWTGSLESNELELKVLKKEKAKANPAGGKPVKGIVALARLVEKPAKGSTSFEVRLSLKNVSTKPITVCAWVGYQPLKVRWLGPDGKMRKSKHYDWLAFVDLAALSKDNGFVTIPPGGVRFITPEILFHPPTEKPVPGFGNAAQVGKHRVTVTFTNNEDGKQFGLQNVWTGTVIAKEITFRVK